MDLAQLVQQPELLLILLYPARPHQVLVQENRVGDLNRRARGITAHIGDCAEHGISLPAKDRHSSSPCTRLAEHVAVSGLQESLG